MQTFFNKPAFHPAHIPLLLAAQATVVNAPAIRAEAGNLLEKLVAGAFGPWTVPFSLPGRLAEVARVAERLAGQCRSGDVEAIFESVLDVWPATRKELSSRYRYLEEATLGRGGCGFVYRGQDHGTGEEVAIKKARICDNFPWNVAESSWRMEAAFLAVLGETGVVPRVIDLGTMNEDPCLIMEIVEGRNLAKFIFDAHHKQTMDAENLNRLFEKAEKIVEAAEKIHQKGVVHRDIKPENLMVQGDGEIKVLDLGSAILGGETRDTFVGTPLYMPPETWMGGLVSPNQDVFALGVTLYKLMTDASPWGYGSSFNDVVREIRSPNTPLRPSQILLEGEGRSPLEPFRPILEAWDVVILKALEKDQQNRYRDAQAMLEAIRALPRIAQQPTTAVNG